MLDELDRRERDERTGRLEYVCPATRDYVHGDLFEYLYAAKKVK